MRIGVIGAGQAWLQQGLSEVVVSWRDCGT